MKMRKKSLLAIVITLIPGSSAGSARFKSKRIFKNRGHESYNHFLSTQQLGTQPLQVRITDIRGISVYDTIPGLPEYGGAAYFVPGNVQLPD